MALKLFMFLIFAGFLKKIVTNARFTDSDVFQIPGRKA
jgi:hypothetical protein